MPLEGGFTYHGHGLIGREIAAIVAEDDQAKRGDQPVSGIACYDVHLLLLQSAIQQAQIHDARLSDEAEAVSLCPAAIAVRTLHELVPEARTPLRRVGHHVGDHTEMQAPGILAADDDRERVVEAERRADVKMEAVA